MKKYEDFINEYVENNKHTLESKAPSKKRLIKFSEAISRAILERKKSDTGYGDLAESLASAGLSDSGYAKYLGERKDKTGLAKVQEAEDKKVHAEALDSYEVQIEKEINEKKKLEAEEKERLRLEKEEKKRLEKEEKERLKLEKEEALRLEKEQKEKEKQEKAEKERLEKEEKARLEAERKAAEKLEKERIAAEKQEAERLEKLAKEREKNKKTLLSFAESNKVTDANVLYTYALSLGLDEADAKEISETAASNVKAKLRVANIEKVRDYIVLQRFTNTQAYAYAISLGLDEADAQELANFAYKLNQDTETFKSEESTQESSQTNKTPKPTPTIKD